VYFLIGRKRKMEKEKLKTIDIKGKEYVLINERIRYFRETYEDGQILTEILSNENGVCLFKATVVINGKIVATGHAQEKEGSTFINKTSYIENAETSAIGRALGIAGIGIDTSIATYEEVKNAINNQNNDDEKLKLLVEFEKLVNATDSDKEKIYSVYKVKNNTEMSIDQFKDAIKVLKQKQVKNNEIVQYNI